LNPVGDDKGEQGLIHPADRPSSSTSSPGPGTRLDATASSRRTGSRSSRRNRACRPARWTRSPSGTAVPERLSYSSRSSHRRRATSASWTPSPSGDTKTTEPLAAVVTLLLSRSMIANARARRRLMIPFATLIARCLTLRSRWCPTFRRVGRAGSAMASRCLLAASRSLTFSLPNYRMSRSIRAAFGSPAWVTPAKKNAASYKMCRRIAGLRKTASTGMITGTVGGSPKRSG
jgi:hypothetical protein